jgi:GTPase KRas protein
MVLCGNKCDLDNNRQVSKAEGNDLARILGCNFLETSAKTGINVQEVFFNLVREIKSELKNPIGRRKACLVM